MEGYDDIALLYNMAVERNIGKSNFSGLSAPKIYAHFNSLDIAGENRQAIDLGCGTGQQSIFLAKNAMQVTAIDISENMLNIAKSNAIRAGCNQHIRFLQQDITSTLPFEPAALITATFNVINHLPDDTSILTLFKKVFHALRFGGVFAFDISTTANLVRWNSLDMQEMECDSGDVEHATVISRKTHYPEEKRNLTEITCFFREKNSQHYRRINSRIYSYMYPLDKLQAMLFDVGFSGVEVVDVDFNPVVNPEALDVVFLLVSKSLNGQLSTVSQL